MEKNNHIFPYRNIYNTDPDRIGVFKHLQNLRLVSYCTEKVRFYPNIKIHQIDFMLSGKYRYLMHNPKNYKYHMLSDLFNDECRADCKFGNHESPYEYFQNNNKKIIDSVIKKGLDVNPDNIREEIYLNTKECSIHNPLIIRYFIEKYKAKNVLDFSSGWGDRLIGSILAGADLYVGVDPNKCLHPNYQKIINLLAPISINKNSKHIMIENGFQNVDLSKVIDDYHLISGPVSGPKNFSINRQIFDLVFTSPPYFDYEVYSKDKDQSILSFGNEDMWLKNFLFKAIDKCFKYLRYDGHMVLYFSQQTGKTYMEKWLQWMKSYPQLYYIGNMFYSDIFFKGLHPIFIFQKSKCIPECLYNPPLNITTLCINKDKCITISKFDNCEKQSKSNIKCDTNLQTIRINVIRDDYLVGGTKNRAIIDYLRDIIDQKQNVNELLYLGASNGYAATAISYALSLLKSHIKFTVFAQAVDSNEIRDIQQTTLYLNPNTKYINLKKSFRDFWPLIDNHIEKHPNSLLLPFGFDDENFKKILHNVLSKHVNIYVESIHRLWMVVGSGILFGQLYKILTKTHFLLVQVGKDVNLDLYNKNRYTLYKSSYKLYKQINIKIPYFTTSSYDGKVWEFCDKFMNGDYIWNVAGSHTLSKN